MTDRLIRIKQYEQAADDKVSFGGIKWLQKWDVCIQCDSAEEAEALRARLAQPEPEPVAWYYAGSRVEPVSVALDCDLDDAQRANCTPLYTAPPQREFIGLTVSELDDIDHRAWSQTVDEGLPMADYCLQLARAIEAKLKDKNA